MIGDDANDLLVLSKQYQRLKSFPLFSYPEKRIPKHLKTDFEAAAFITLVNQDYLLVAGSASKKIRERFLIIPVINHELDLSQNQMINVGVFINRLKDRGVAEVNLEGMTLVNNQLLLSNRGNQSNPVNQIIVTQPDFWKNQGDSDFKLMECDYSQYTDGILSVSELCYELSTDTLLITFSSEATSNAYEDGEIGNSYLGYVRNARQKIEQSVLHLNGMINLAEQNEAFAGEKIEGICVEEVNDEELILHMVSDNDLGASRLFKCSLIL